MNHSFSKWLKWDNEGFWESIPKRPGIYCIAFSQDDISDCPFDWIEAIEYIGMSNERKTGLKSRLRDFEKSFKTLKGHTGSAKMRKSHKYSEMPIQLFFSNLYVAFWSFDYDTESEEPLVLRTKGKVAELEYMCLAEYSENFGKTPYYNGKVYELKRIKIRK